MDKRKILRIIARIVLYISFVPYACLLGYAIVSAIGGASWFTSHVHGLDAFLLIIFIVGYLYIGIFAVCLAYQLIYLIIYLLNRRKNKRT